MKGGPAPKKEGGTLPQTNMEALSNPLEDLVPFTEAFWELPAVRLSVSAVGTVGTSHPREPSVSKRPLPGDLLGLGLFFVFFAGVVFSLGPKSQKQSLVVLDSSKDLYGFIHGSALYLYQVSTMLC